MNLKFRLQQLQTIFSGVGGRLALSFVAVSLLVLIPSLFWFYYSAQELTEKRIQDLLSSVLEHDSSLLNSSVENRDLWQLYRLVKSMAQPEHIISVALVDEYGNLLAHSDSAYYNRKLFPPIYDKSYEIIALEGIRGHLGEIIIHRDLAKLKAYFDPVKKGLVLISIIFTCLAALLGVLIAVFWRNRLVKILEHINKRSTPITLTPKGDELKQLEDYLLNSFEQLSIAKWTLDSVRESVILIDAFGAVHSANAAAKSICACGQCYKGMLQLLDAPTRLSLEKDASGTVKINLKVCDSSFPALLSFRHYLGSTEQALKVVTITDLTDYQRLESRLEKLRVLSLLGEMSTELAHEIRNDLVPVRLLCEISNLEAQDKKVILSSLNRVDGMIEGFMSFVRDGQTSSVSQVNLAQLINEAYKCLASLAHQNKVQVHVKAEDVAVNVSAGAFNLILINLLRNAIQAAANQIDKQVWVEAWLDEHNINVRITDTGAGISPEVAEKLFEPFVSNKKGGTGMGLALVLRHVDEVGGKIGHTPRQGGGTIFNLSWPLVLTFLSSEE